MVYYQPPDQNWMTPIRSPVHDPSPIHGRSNGPPSFFPPSHRARQHTNLPWWRPWTDPPILGPSAWIPDPTDAKRREDVCEPEGGAYHRRRAEREASYSTRRLQGPFPPAEATTSIYLYWRSWFTPPRAPGYSVGMGIIGGCYSLSLSLCVCVSTLAQSSFAWRSTDGCARVFWFNGLRVALYTAREPKTESQQPAIEFGIKLCFSVGVCCALDSDPRQGRG
jgi:hypothetical protein